MPRRSRHLGHHGASSARAPRPAARPEAGGGLRALVEEGIITAAALNARDDLEMAAVSTQRLGALTSGMWRSLSRELATAAERLDRSTSERLEAIERRARALDVDADDVIVAGVAAAHLAEHRETLDTLIKPDDDAQRLLRANMLFGFSVDALAPYAPEDDSAVAAAQPLEEEDVLDDDESVPGAVHIALFLWPAPLTPATVSIGPSLAGGLAGSDDVTLNLALAAPAPLLEALTTASDLAGERVTQALSTLAVACWTAHHLDEESDEEDEAEDTDADVEHDAGRSGGDGV